MTKLVTVILLVSAAGTGLRAAYLWWQTSRVSLLKRPDWSGDDEMNRMSREADQLEAWQEIGRLNAQGAKWTALAAGLSATAGIASLF